MGRKNALYNKAKKHYAPNLALLVEQSLNASKQEFGVEDGEDIAMAIILLHLLKSKQECPSVSRALDSLDIQRNLLNILPRSKFSIPSCPAKVESVEEMLRKNFMLKKQVAYYQLKLKNLHIPDDLNAEKGKTALDALLEKELEVHQIRSGEEDSEENLPTLADAVSKMQMLQKTLDETIDQYTFAEKRRKERKDSLECLMQSFFRTIGDRSSALDGLLEKKDKMKGNPNPSEDDLLKIKRVQG
jgi:hypothetical protein